MRSVIKRICITAGVVLLSLFGVYLLGAVSVLADLVARIHPELAPWAVFLCLVLIAYAVWRAATPFFRPHALMLSATPDEAELEAYKKELLGRLRTNDFLREQGVSLESEEDVQNALVLLQLKANEDIRKTAKQVFTGTAVSQNGKLDSLIVLTLLARLIWRISALYNQRPAPSELLSLYSNVAVTSFLAAGIEDLGGEEAMGSIIGPAVASSALGALPGAEAVATAVTASLVDGSANALLTLRTGILARNYLSGSLSAHGGNRRAATAEALSMLADISGETIKAVLSKTGQAAAQVCGKKIGDAVSAGARTARKAAEGVVDGVGGAARTVGTGVGGAAKAVGTGVGGAARAVGAGVRSAIETAGTGVNEGACVIRNGAVGAAATVGNSASVFGKSVAKGALGSARSIGSGVKEGGRVASGLWSRAGIQSSKIWRRIRRSR
ncbi:YcjF family protein [Desulfovibrio mangrovi]|uniref:DUF697 domain-containing protein n=1 Tax=Desulfovibrio mangrovi TaxID=2976983 RepID=UPI00224874C1|nr:DUF697 domain-containing protein [Desulfovibrio mangrovi]UZP67589.1 YcjF family protein [Desulfovibrio mangrovi]